MFFRSAIFALMLILSLNPAMAMMESRPHELPLADTGTVGQIVAVTGGREFVGSSKQIYAEHWFFGKATFLIARVEDATCDGEFCPTAFISELEQGSKIIGIGWLPKQVLYGDVTYTFCQACGDVDSITFSGSQGSEITIGLSSNYLVLARNR